MSVPEPFDLTGELPEPRTTTVLEASAGTGKTFTIAALAARYVADGLDLRELMLVTFGRMATQELRQRVRERLVTAERGLADPDHARSDAHDDEVLRLLADGSDDDVGLRRARLAAALADFDAATLTTTHGFCQQMLRGLGVAGDLEPDATFVESIDDLVVEVASDLWLRKFGRPDSGEPAIRWGEALAVARQAVEDGQAALAPALADPASSAGQRVGIARAARDEVARRKRQRRLVDYDDLLTRLCDALTDPATGEAASERVRSRYSVVMVDEFQDTDPVQWDILRTAFHGRTTLILIGDPKQAIYAFRGGDVAAYLDATKAAGTPATLDTNHRSDAGLLRGLDALLGQTALGDEGIVVRPVRSAHPAGRLHGAPVDRPVRLRHALRTDTGTAPRKNPVVRDSRDLVARDLAGDVVRLLSCGARLETPRGERPLVPGDVAVLAHTNKQAGLARDALAAVGVPAVVTGAANVFGTDVAQQWLLLLQALEQPRGARLRTAALTCFVGWTAQDLATKGDAALDDLGPKLRGWADVLARRGLPALLERITEEEGLTARLLATEVGERVLTDLRHVAQALHQAAVEGQLGTAALVEWLQHRILDASTDPSEERVRRLESDADAVQVVTVHRSKGLEFPVVYVPFGWDRYKPRNPDPLRLHIDGVRTLDVGGIGGPEYGANLAVHRAEEAGEDLRLLYVALTRAACQVVTWWAPSTTTSGSATHRLLFGGHLPGQTPADSVPLPSDDEAVARFAVVAAQAGGSLAVERIEPDHGLRWSPPADQRQALAAARFDRALDTAWRRLSYTALTAGVHDQLVAPGDGRSDDSSGAVAAVVPGVSAEPDERGLDDEAGVVPADADAAGPPADALVSPMAELPSGAAFGIVVHSVLEYADTTVPDLAAELTRHCAEVLAHRLGSGLDPEVLGPALVPSMETPLGPLAGDMRLRDVAAGDKLSELDFELPLAGGDDPTGDEATLSAMAEVLRTHLAPDDALVGYPDLLARLPSQALRGYLTGSLDAVLRVAGPDGPRYLVADYKTNWLGDGWPGSDTPLTAWHYRPAALTSAMLDAHYPLQALLYLVALHRYLSWRQPGYDPDVHLGGALYLFVRGMCGPDTPVVDGTPAGVFGWRPPSGLVPALSRLLAGGGA